MEYLDDNLPIVQKNEVHLSVFCIHQSDESIRLAYRHILKSIMRELSEKVAKINFFKLKHHVGRAYTSD